MPVHRMELGRIRFTACLLTKRINCIFDILRTKFMCVLFVQHGWLFHLHAVSSLKLVIVLDRYVINSYLRARLQKIESQIWHYTGPGEAGSRMTQVGKKNHLHLA